jgi:hypothetical protein
MRACPYSSGLAVLFVVASLGGCVNIEKVHQPPGTLRENIRQGELIRAGDRIAVVSSSLGERIFVVTEVDQEAIRGKGIEVPIDDVVALETRALDPVRTGLALYGGYGAAGFAMLGLIIFSSLLGF